MELSRRATLGLAAAAIVASFGTAAFAGGGTINVSLWDSGDNALDNMGTAAPIIYGGNEDMSNATMGIKTDVKTISAGEVTFAVTNDSKSTIHEMILSPAPAAGQKLPYDDNMNAVIEDEAGHLGEVSELDPGAKGALTVTLKPGKYILYCNIPGHYIMGMWTTVDVTP
ncbi:MAG: hypothetical protein GC146_15675 [Limimaricola sp.]|uniref:plastocyanin/azurin family copper-binding protein n=1 Tax=Limimaricola sp. TaxID=2211665 RepID=UPI001DE3FBF3|nr:plastocyanin/azurin family copper-binding protein [Limimaricola sp.]MBI1418654.1 hypothetical protein [Limimaricola sp.]